MKIKKFLVFLSTVLLLCTAPLLTAQAAWTLSPELSLSASLSGNGQTVTVTLKTTASDPVCALQTEIYYDAKVLTSVGKPDLSKPWSSALASADSPAAGTAAVALVSASGLENTGGTVAEMSFTVADKDAASAYFYIHEALVSSSDGSLYEPSDFSFITLDLKSLSSDGGHSSVPGAVPSSYLSVAERLAGTVILQNGNYAAVIGGYLAPVDSDNKSVTPYVNGDGRSMVPLRFISEALGATVGWDGAKQQIAISSGKSTLVLAIGSLSYTVNGKEQHMDTSPVINAGLNRTMVPVRFIMEAFGMSVDWDEVNSLIIVTPADKPWDKDGSTEEKATEQILNLLSKQMRDFM
jgi:hypothetical protein